MAIKKKTVKSKKSAVKKTAMKKAGRGRPKVAAKKTAAKKAVKKTVKKAAVKKAAPKKSVTKKAVAKKAPVKKAAAKKPAAKKKVTKRVSKANPAVERARALRAELVEVKDKLKASLKREAGLQKMLDRVGGNIEKTVSGFVKKEMAALEKALKKKPRKKRAKK